MENTATQQEIFSLEGNQMGRTKYRELTTNTEYMKKVDIDLIEIRPDNFNARQKPEWMNEEMYETNILQIPELADGIFASNGPTDAIRGDFHSKDGKFYITTGERRTRAIRHLIRTGRDTYPNGDPVAMVLVMMNPFGTTEIERLRLMLNENDKLELTPMQRAKSYLRLKEKHNLSNEEIAKLFPGKLSRQSVDNYITATTLPKETQDKIDSGEIKITHALAELRKDRKKVKNPDEIELLSPSQEFHREEEEKKKEKLRGDEDDFEEEDNTVKGTSSKSGPKEDRSSGAHVIPKDGIYMQQENINKMKQFFHRYEHFMNGARQLIVADKPEDERDEQRAAILYEKRHAHAIEKLTNEYEIIVK